MGHNPTESQELFFPEWGRPTCPDLFSWLEGVGEMGGVGSILNGHFSSQESSAIMNYTEHVWI